MQLRNVLHSLLDRSLPFDRSEVHALLQQAFYHVGEVRNEGGGLFYCWKQDMVKTELIPTMGAVIASISTELQDCPSRYEAAILIGTVACFLSNWNGDVKSVARDLAKSALDWADDYGNPADSAVSDDYTDLRIHQRLRLCVPVICLVGGPIVYEDVRLAIKCHLLGRNVCATGGKGASQLLFNLTRVEALCHNALSSYINQIIQVIKEDPSLLSDAVRSVLAKFPEKVGWTARDVHSASFEAKDSEGTTYIECVDRNFACEW
jgi:hypothetical protein